MAPEKSGIRVSIASGSGVNLFPEFSHRSGNVWADARRTVPPTRRRHQQGAIKILAPAGYFSGPYPVGTVIVNTKTYFLHLIQEGGKAMRYDFGLGRQGFEWSGEGVIQWKQDWPKWTLPDEMIARRPDLAKWSASNGGMPPGHDNPLGARALYIFQNGEDTLHRIHGSPEYWTIGKSVSSGCVRIITQDVVDLYGRVTSGAKLIAV